MRRHRTDLMPATTPLELLYVESVHWQRFRDAGYTAGVPTDAADPNIR